MSTQSFFTKDSDAVLDYDVDWSAWLGTDTITTATWIADPSNGDATLTVGSTPHTDTAAKVWLSGGTVGVDYRMTCRIVTAGGRTNDRTITIGVRAL